jgi:hypothetical protein
MARLRTIKPEFWSDAAVGECSPSARLLFVATWNFADDHGGLDRNAKQLKAQAFPYDAIDCEPLVQELLRAGLLVEYVSNGKKYLHIRNFQKHQKIEKPSSPRIPLYDPSVNPPRALTEPSPTPRPSSLGSSSLGSCILESTRARETICEQPVDNSDAAHDEFTKLQQLYPAGTYRKADWLIAEREARRAVEEGLTTWAQWTEAIRRYGGQHEAKGGGSQYVQSPAKFFAVASRSWAEAFPVPTAKRNGANGHEEPAAKEASAAYEALLASSGIARTPRVEAALASVGGWLAVQGRTFASADYIRRDFIAAYLRTTLP